MSREHQICKRCVMDTTDTEIVFDENGFCNHCTNAFKKLNSYPLNLSKAEKEKELQKIVADVKESGKKNDYDCVVGVSGGVDSSYVLYLVKKQLGLRPLAFHLDNEWDTELSVKNIEKIIKKLDVKLHTMHVDWDEFKELQLSFLKSSTPDLEIPTDHALYATLYNVASEYKLKYIISGANIITENISVPTWSHGHYDWRYIKIMQKKFGTRKLTSFPHLSMYNLASQQLFRRKKIIRILNYVPEYDKKKIISFLEKEFGWQNYITKHAESIYTFFVQAYILPTKFNYDKRKMHLSDLICSGQITRNEALDTLKKPLFTESELHEMIGLVCNKFGITKKEFDTFMRLPNKSYYDYPSYETHPIYRIIREVYKKVNPQT
ncbi:MAG: N-acetyl sugar amidotransferase [Candidatus Thermoplasmatota archaeon]|nr:N-acetyl sugar amidotransferase [Candidatus Thermoplasmatota archaeon]